MEIHSVFPSPGDVLLDQFLDRISSASDQASAWRAGDELFSNFGFDRNIYVDSRTTSGETTLFTSLPRSWQAHYREQRYERIDPFFQYCCATRTPIGTGAAYLPDHPYLDLDQRRLILEASEAGMTAGFSCTTRKSGPAGAGGWNIGSSLPRAEVERILAQRYELFQLAAQLTHERITTLPSGTGREIAELSVRERECLSWSASGLRTKQIAQRMGLRPVTVELYLKNARKKLGAATREQAVSIALLDGLIDL